MDGHDPKAMAVIFTAQRVAADGVEYVRPGREAAT
tara:strand:- start:65 stop:169 length:105 start_codon:yes stop_codon:yes gene_type:complete